MTSGDGLRRVARLAVSGVCGCATALGLDGLCTGLEGGGIEVFLGMSFLDSAFGVSICVRWWHELGIRMWAMWGWERGRRGDG